MTTPRMKISSNRRFIGGAVSAALPNATACNGAVNLI
jgi:hypothetical protein